MADDLFAASILNGIASGFMEGMKQAEAGKLAAKKEAREARKEQRDIETHNITMQSKKLDLFKNLRNVDYVSEDNRPVFRDEKSGEFRYMDSQQVVNDMQVRKTSEVFGSLPPDSKYLVDKATGENIRITVDPKSGEILSRERLSSKLRRGVEIKGEERQNWVPLYERQRNDIAKNRTGYFKRMQSFSNLADGLSDIARKLENYKNSGFKDKQSALDVNTIAAKWASLVQDEKRKTDEDIVRAKPQFDIFESSYNKLLSLTKLGGKLTPDMVREYDAALKGELETINRTLLNTYKQEVKALDNIGVPTDGLAREFGRPLQVGRDFSDNDWKNLLESADQELEMPGFKKAQQEEKKKAELAKKYDFQNMSEREQLDLLRRWKELKQKAGK